MRIFIFACALVLSGCTATQRTALKKVARPAVECVKEHTPQYLYNLKLCVERKLQDGANKPNDNRVQVGKGDE